MKLYRAVVLLVAFTCTACTSVSGATVQTTAGSSGHTTRAHVGDTITISGDSGKMDVTVVKVEDVHATSQYEGPVAGDRFVGVQIRFKNLGTATFSDAIDNEVTGQDAQGQSYTTEGAPEAITEGPVFPIPLNLAGAGTALGWSVLSVPTGTQLSQVQVILSSGFGNGGVWLVP